MVVRSRELIVLGENTLFAGPIFSREALTSPRQLRHFLIRAGYIVAFSVLMYTFGQATFGWQQVRNVSDISRFGSLIFQVLSIVQLSLVLFFALLFAAGSVAAEKDRKTLVLLLMTDLRNRELVFGKLFASLLMVAVLLAASAPVFALIYLLGGVSLEQIGWALAICGSTGFAAGSWGSLVGYAREKTFQTLAISVLGVVLALGVSLSLAGSPTLVGRVMTVLDPFQAMGRVLDPFAVLDGSGNASALQSVLALMGIGVVLNLVAIARLRVWNPPRMINAAPQTDDGADAKVRSRTRNVWALPVIWREIRTRAYGRKVFLIRMAYLLLSAAAFVYVDRAPDASTLVLGMISPPGAAFVALTLISLMLINTQAVTALTSERDGQTLELLLVTNITAREFIFGKLGGVFYNAKELIVIPPALGVALLLQGRISAESLTYVIVGYLVLAIFSATLGMHSGLSFLSSRSAIANSLGTMFFLFIGVFIFMMLLVEAQSSFALQMQSFIVIIGAGSVALLASLSHRTPSPALTASAFSLPFITFYAITEFLLQGSLGVCVAIVVAYGFTTLAMMIPAISEFDAALGRSGIDTH